MPRRKDYFDFDQLIDQPCMTNFTAVKVCKRTATVVIMRAPLGKPYALCLRCASRYLTAAFELERSEKHAQSNGKVEAKV